MAPDHHVIMPFTATILSPGWPVVGMVAPVVLASIHLLCAARVAVDDRPSPYLIIIRISYFSAGSAFQSVFPIACVTWAMADVFGTHFASFYRL